MSLETRVQKAFQRLEDYSPEGLKHTLLRLNISIEELQSYLKTPEGKPYYRQMIYADDKVEMIVMNWAEIECSPHDHGQSSGWIQVMNGTTKQTVYQAQGESIPLPLFTEYKENGSLFFAPKHGIHKMGREGDPPLVTLHLYSPPIRGMRVFDLKACAACVVSSDCGAWWPEEQRQRLKDIQLKK
ncbi:cysteine dioxygenase [Halobacillus karajensis]|uniref:Cysteine dioxygenase n=1 Tax=Halobacillus karajensis TaxID=195088 RepID=A0A024P9A6_9BACI|nr:cysteine dioxygenase family protein [Halobacillus karajensis]CDQ21595.1 Cysteine dioxygenase [Halobacillus karajensis]CDQ25530.1 Cysteine dioxygenase [Halobacillus karajensis]CDQ28940.1 Cysteine dioxygenase [Halobacillus karajensis]SEI08658.1 cysteine dioxygenase [Halobacillus karajensis]